MTKPYTGPDAQTSPVENLAYSRAHARETWRLPQPQHGVRTLIRLPGRYVQKLLKYAPLELADEIEAVARRRWSSVTRDEVERALLEHANAPMPSTDTPHVQGDPWGERWPWER